MAVEFKLPPLGENVKSADVLTLLVKVGDVIKKEQSVLEAETDKAVMEIPSSVAGKVTAVHIKKGDKVTPGQIVITVDETAAAAAPTAKPAATPAPAAVKPAPAPAAPPAPAPAPVAAKVAAPAPSAPAPSPHPPTPASPDRPPVAAAPSTRQFAREIGIDIHEVPPGPDGRIGVDEVKAYARQRATQPRSAGPAALGAAPALPRTVREPMSKIRKVTAAHMAKCWAEVPHVTVFDKADVSELEQMRQQFKAKAEKAGGKLTITAIFVKIAAAALKVFPNLNASIDVAKEEVEHHNFYNIGVAVDTPRGLVVPVIRDADRKNIIQIAVELSALSVKAREGTLTPDDMSGGTFTITNLGSIGIGYFTPIVNVPQVAILGMGKAIHEPVHNASGDFTTHLLAPLSLSFDHRLVDGADGARFLRWIIDAVQNPMLLSLEG